MTDEREVTEPISASDSQVDAEEINEEPISEPAGYRWRTGWEGEIWD